MSTATTMSRGGVWGVFRWVLIVLHTALGVSAVSAGLALAKDPSGAPLTFEVQWLDGSPFDDYRIPGLFLALVIGSTNLLSAVGQWRRRAWAPFASLGTGVLLMTWMTIQTLIIEYQHWTQVGWAAIFALVAALGAYQLRRRRPVD